MNRPEWTKGATDDDEPLLAILMGLCLGVSMLLMCWSIVNPDGEQAQLRKAQMSAELAVKE